MKLKFVPLFLTLLIAFAHTSNGQSDSITVVPNIKACIQKAISTHPTAKAANLEVNKRTVLQKSAFNPEGLAINYGYGNMNSSLLDYGFDVSQSFDFPTEYSNRKKLLDKEKVLSQYQQEVQLKVLRKEVQSAYNTLLFHKNRLLLLKDFNEHFELFEAIAEKHFQEDSTLALEHASAYARHQEILVMIEQEKLDIAIARNNLQLWTNDFNILDIQDSILTKVTKAPNELLVYTTVEKFISPFELLQTAELEIAQQEVKVNRAAMTPDINVGYFNNQIDGQPGFDGIMVGTTLPLFMMGQRKEVQASKIETQRIQSEIANTRNTINTEVMNHKLAMIKFNNMIEFFEEQGVSLSNELVAGADERFKLGEIGYVEYLRDLDQAFEMTSQYLENLRDFNESWFTIMFLTSMN